jgi:uncharacterized membrane protein (UPF0136 family)
MLVPFLLVASLASLVGAFYVWRATSSRPSLISGIFGSLALLVSARMVSVGQASDMTVGLPLLVGMLFIGRAIGTWLRVRKESTLREIAIIWTITGTLCLTSAVWIYLVFVHS